MRGFTDGMARFRAGVCVALVALVTGISSAETPYLYGIHDHEPRPDEFLNHVKAQVSGGWVTATVAVGANPSDNGGVDFTWFSSRGHTVICRINYGYCAEGSIPLPSQYANFAQRCRNFVLNSPGCSIWIIGNETNLAVEWPPSGGHKSYLSPQEYANCFRLAYNAIKAVRPNDTVVSQALAPWGGPYGTGTACGYTHDAMPLNWCQYLNQMLTAIKSTGGIDGIALHITSRGYRYEDIHSTQKVSANGQSLYFSFYVYKDWVDYGIPSDLYHLPLYATEVNGNYYWKGGHPENPAAHYEAGWMQEIFHEINAYNQSAAVSGKPIYHCLNFYRWCAYCDPWNIDGADNPYKAQILSDLDAALAQHYTWPNPGESQFTAATPTGTNLALQATAVQTDSVYGAPWGGANAIDGVVSAASKWTSADATPPHWIALDLGGTRTVNGFILRLPGAAGELTTYNAEAFEFQVASAITGPWTSDGFFNNGSQASVFARSYVTPKSLRYVRLLITDPGVDNIARLPEFEVWGQPPAPPPVAAFTSNVTSGNPPLTVQFLDQSTGAISSRLWSFGDGSTSATASPAHLYDVPGKYTVSLTVTGVGGSDVETKTNYITVNATAGTQLLRNADFAGGLSPWTKWTQRDGASDFAATVVGGALRCTGSDYNGGVYQSFYTGGAGNRIAISGYWKSDPAVAAAQWGEIIAINGSRLPVDGVDETPASKPDDVLIFKNDTWTTPGGWDGLMGATSPVTNVGEFIAAGEYATIIIKSGNGGGALTGLTADDLYVRVRNTPGDFDDDGDVDLGDFGFFQLCYNGPNRPPIFGDCGPCDFDGDGDADLADFGVFLACFNGPNRPPPAICGG